MINTSATTSIHLSGVEITEAVRFDFATSSVETLEPGQSVVVVRDQVAFRSRYGAGPTIAGQFTGRLGNGGEQIRLQEHGVVILDFTYQDDWHPASDGAGRSLVIVEDGGAVLFSAQLSGDDWGLWRIVLSATSFGAPERHPSLVNLGAESFRPD